MLWLKATIFKNSERTYSLSENATVCCGLRSQVFKTHKKLGNMVNIANTAILCTDKHYGAVKYNISIYDFKNAVASISKLAPLIF